MNKILLSVLFLFSVGITGVIAQKTEKKDVINTDKITNANNWILSASWSSVDMRGPDDFSGFFRDYIGTSDQNFYYFPSKFAVERSLNRSFSMQIAASFNKIEKNRGWNDKLPKSDISFLAFDGKLKFDLNTLIGDTKWFDPFIETGFGVTEYDDQAMLNLKAGAGANFWFAKNWGVTANTSYNHNFEKSGNDYFQHSLGLAYRFKQPTDNYAYASHVINNSARWLVSLGYNFLDVRTSRTGDLNFKEITHDYFNGDFEDVNASGLPFRATVERKFNNKFGIQAGFSMGEFVKPYEYPSVVLKDENYWAADLKGTYDLNNLVGDTAWFDPFINLGVGYSDLGGESDFKVNGGYGANFWLFENVGIKAESSYNHAFNQDGTDFFQHTAGLVYRFDTKYKDTDRDGVLDHNDSCPEEPGTREMNGCPDSDGDGIHDAIDSCPKVAGLKLHGGCPDTDKDGIMDKNDECPEVAGPKDNKGCPWPDTDKDGVTDNVDKCPKEAGVVANNGCPEPAQVVDNVTPQGPTATECELQFREINTTEIFFDFDKAFLKPSEKAKLDRVVEILNTTSCSVGVITLTGYADTRGSKLYNKRLSRRRAEAVKSYLRSKGINNLQDVGDGETDSRPTFAENRRVEIRVN